MHYRPEIDGLRAIAVLIVLIFHINHELMPGGFIGVDIFFVISGFLITTILKQSLDKGNFDYKLFYTRRIKRLIPLFFAVLIFTLIGGYYILLPADFQSFATDVLVANFFLANIKFAFGNNYFESEQPLLHFWSLAVEEQFYFIMPTLLLIIYKFFRKYLLPILILIFISSFALAEYMSLTPKYAQLSYFLLPTRAWELIAGCLLATTKIKINDKIAGILSILGIIFIIIGIFVIDKKSVFPGMITFLPVFGSVLIILGGDKGGGPFLSAKPFVFIGLASYSIYMWHWPIVIFIKSLFKIQEFSIMQTLLILIIIIGIGYLSQIYIEDYFRFKKNINFKRAVMYYFLIPLLITSGFSFYVYSNKGLPSRYGIDVIYTTTATKKCSHFDVGCFITQYKVDDNKVLMIGDSHADHFANLFSMWFDDKKISLRLFAAGGCNFYSKSFYNSKCEDVKVLLKSKLQNVRNVIIAKRFDNQFKNEVFKNEFYNYVTNLTEMGKSVILIKQVPKFKDSDFLKDWMESKRFGVDFDYNDNAIDSLYMQGNDEIINLFSSNRNVHILDFNNILLVDYVPKKFDENMMPLYYNSNHLTAHGGEWIYNKIKVTNSFDWVINLIK